MTKEEMLKALAEGQNPLVLSIQKWRDIASGTEIDLSTENCALCEMFINADCSGCPIMTHTKAVFCRNSPYEKFLQLGDIQDVNIEEILKLAKEMLVFLEDLQKKYSYQ